MSITNSRATLLGLLPPRAELAIPVFPPLAENEEPVVFGRVGEIILTKPAPNLVVLRSTVDRQAGYVLVFMPSSVVRLARVPWAEVMKQAAQYAKTIMSDVANAGPRRAQ